MRTLRIILILLAVAAVTPSPFDATAGQEKGDKAHGCPKGWFPATGQTTPYTAVTQTGAEVTVPDDGTVQAGAPLRYTDNGDGTITDNNTGLMWKKKSSVPGDLHAWGNQYYWSNLQHEGIPTIWEWLAAVNAEGGTGFAGYNDWRIPNIKELLSIIDFENYNPAVDPVFNTNCPGGNTVLTGSCTNPVNHWSSTTSVSQNEAWMVDFSIGIVNDIGKSWFGIVRAVRGGCVPAAE